MDANTLQAVVSGAVADAVTARGGLNVPGSQDHTYVHGVFGYVVQRSNV